MNIMSHRQALITPSRGVYFSSPVERGSINGAVKKMKLMREFMNVAELILSVAVQNAFTSGSNKRGNGTVVRLINGRIALGMPCNISSFVIILSIYGVSFYFMHNDRGHWEPDLSAIRCTALLGLSDFTLSSVPLKCPNHGSHSWAELAILAHNWLAI
jgi:hypothetical protein